MTPVLIILLGLSPIMLGIALFAAIEFVRTLKWWLRARRNHPDIMREHAGEISSDEIPLAIRRANESYTRKLERRIAAKHRRGRK